MPECGEHASDVRAWKRDYDTPDLRADGRTALIDEPSKAPCINDFVGLLSVGEELQNDFARVGHDVFGLASTHCRLRDERCGNIDNLRNFPRSSRLVGYQVRFGHHNTPLPTV